MAKVCYLSTTGSDANSGLTAALPKLTVSGVRAITAIGDRVSIAGGTYVFTSATIFSSVTTDPGVVWMPDGSGQVYFDGGGTSGILSFSGNSSPIFIGIHFKNVASGGALVTSSNVNVYPMFIHCMFYSTLGAGTRVGITGAAHVENCTFYSLGTGLVPSNTGVNGYLYRGNYFKTVTTPISTGNPAPLRYMRSYNALPSNTEVDGINTSAANSDPGFININFAAGVEDFRLHPTTDAVAYAKFKNQGFRNGMIGAIGTPGPFYDCRFAPTRMITADPTPTTGTFPAWEDDPSYVAAGTLGAIIQDPTTNTLVLDLATTPTATDGRIRSDVFDSGTNRSWNLRSIVVEHARDARHGSALDSNNSLPFVYEYRGSSSSFAKGDVSPAWTTIERDDSILVNYRYVQFRLTLWRTHTNA